MTSFRSRAAPHALDADSDDWLESLTGDGAGRQEAIGRLHALLLGAARRELARRRAAGPQIDRQELDDIAMQSADDALVAVLAKLPQFRGDSRFTTWAYKFAVLEAGVKLRRREWRDRELPLEPDRWPELDDGRPSPPAQAELSDLLRAVWCAIDTELTPHQREVLVAIVLGDVPIDVLSERLATTRGALYKTIHDARHKLRRRLEADGYPIEGILTR